MIKAINYGELKIDSQGRIWRMKTRKGLKSGGSRLYIIEPKRAEHRIPLGYLQIISNIDGKRVSGCAHRLIWQYFFGDIPIGLCINHKNGIKDDNRPRNLEIVTYSENRKHAFRTGLINQNGEKNPNVKISNKDVERIRQLYSTGNYKQIDLAKRFDTSFQSVSRIVRGERRPSQNGLIDIKDHRGCVGYKRNPQGRFITKKKAGRLLDGKEWNQYPGDK